MSRYHQSRSVAAFFSIATISILFTSFSFATDLDLDTGAGGGTCKDILGTINASLFVNTANKYCKCVGKDAAGVRYTRIDTATTAATCSAAASGNESCAMSEIRTPTNSPDSIPEYMTDYIIEALKRKESQAAAICKGPEDNLNKCDLPGECCVPVMGLPGFQPPQAVGQSDGRRGYRVTAIQGFTCACVEK